jgi:hypothetical protein
VDRTKDLVKSGGEWISSVELESAIMSHPKVAEAAVIGVPHERWVERPLACVVLEPGETLTFEELRAHPAAVKVSEAGSARRRRETFRDLDVIATSTDPPALIEAFTSRDNVADVIAKGDTKATVLTNDGLRLDLRVVPPESYGNLLQHFTGSKAHNVALREEAVTRGLSVALIERRDLAVEKVDLAQAAIEGQTLVDRQLQLGEPAPSRLAERVGHRRPLAQVAREHAMRLVLGARPSPHDPFAPVGQPPQRPRPLVRRPHPLQQTRHQQPRERARVEAIGLGLGLGDRLELARVGDHDPDALALEQRDDLVGPRRRLQRDNVAGHQALREQLQ